MLLGLDIGETTTSELGLSGCRTTEIRWSPRWLLVHSWSERRGSTSRSGELGSSASKKRVSVVMDEPAAAPELDLLVMQRAHTDSQFNYLDN